MNEKEAGKISGDVEQGYGYFMEFNKASTIRKIWAFKQPPRLPTEDWMALLDDDTPLSAVTLPGTHDSAAFGSSWPFVSTQKLNILDQLNAGIRYFDLRCGIRVDVVEMVHGPYYLSLTLEKILGTMYAWLVDHPSEGLIVQIKKDRKGNRSTIRFPNAILELLARAPALWRISNTTPTVGELRGRIQLFRRFGGTSIKPYGINVTRWVDNPPEPFTIHLRHNVQITIQDHYSFAHRQTLPSLIKKKGVNISELLDCARNDPDPNHWYLNFTSAFEFNVFYQIQPHQIAVGGRWRFRWVEGINVRLRAYLHNNKGPRRRFGIVAMDFPEQGADDLIAALIKTNFEPLQVSFGTLLAARLPMCMLILCLGAGYWLLMQWRNLTLIETA